MVIFNFESNRNFLFQLYHKLEFHLCIEIMIDSSMNIVLVLLFYKTRKFWFHEYCFSLKCLFDYYLQFFFSSKLDPYLLTSILYHRDSFSFLILHHHFPRRAILNTLKSLIPSPIPPFLLAYKPNST
jgi:hypothetical protein